MVTVSQKFKIAVKLGSQPAYRYAQAAGIDPTVLSKLIRGYWQIEENDPRVIAVGKVLGLSPRDCFEEGHHAA